MLETNHTLTTATKKEPTRASKKKQTKKKQQQNTSIRQKIAEIGFSFYM